MDASVMISHVAAGAGIAFVPALIPLGPGVAAIDVDHLVSPNGVVAAIDPNRFHRRFVYEFIELIAPQWTKRRIDRAIRDAVFAMPSVEVP
jgi:DNA-binding transcriptional LysR family regulator